MAVMPHPRLAHGRRAQAYHTRTQAYFTNRNELAMRLKASGRLRDAIATPCAIKAAFHFPDRRRRDIDNLLKTLFDALMTAGIITDDSLITEIAHAKIHRGSKGEHVAVVLQEVTP
jgi:Holliday junction resolvase RusA-like endonuclease